MNDFGRRWGRTAYAILEFDDKDWADMVTKDSFRLFGIHLPVNMDGELIELEEFN